MVVCGRSNKCGVVCRVGRTWEYVREVLREEEEEEEEEDITT